MRDPRFPFPLRAAALSAALALAVGACASASAGWTFAPEPPPTPVPSASSAAPSATAAPSTSADASASAGASGGTGGGPTVQVAALNIAFDRKDIAVPAGQAFTLDFDNQDSGIPHNVAIRDASGQQVFTGEIFNGPAQRAYQVQALAAGTAYTFVCDLHPNMTGTVTVQ